MGQVHGPYDIADWKTMGFLKKKTKHFKRTMKAMRYGMKVLVIRPSFVTTC